MIKRKRKSELDALYENLSFIYFEQSFKPSRCCVTAKQPSKCGLKWNLYEKLRDEQDDFNLYGDDTCSYKGSCNELDLCDTTIQTNQSTTSDSCTDIDMHFPVGDIILCWFERFGWWFGKVVKMKQKPQSGKCWVYLFGDRKHMQMSYDSLRHHRDFSKVFRQHKMKKTSYKIAVREFLLATSQFYGYQSDYGRKKGYLTNLLKWALNGFYVTNVKNSSPVRKRLSTSPPSSYDSKSTSTVGYADSSDNNSNFSETPFTSTLFSTNSDLMPCAAQDFDLDSSLPSRHDFGKLNNKGLKKKTKGGIFLDASLIGTNTPKRTCTSHPLVKLPARKAIQRRRKTTNDTFFGHFLKNSLPRVNGKETMTANRDLLKCPYQIEVNVNDLVIGKLRGFDWWFGTVSTCKRSGQKLPEAGWCWVRWFGDGKISLMQKDGLEHLDMFPQRFIRSKMRGGLYRLSVDQMLTEAARRCNKLDLPYDEEQRLVELVEWALGGFLPGGIQALVIEEEICESSDEEDSTSADCSNGLLLSPTLSHDIKSLFEKVKDGNTDINKLCLSCGDIKCVIEHPLFKGGLCRECKDSFMECVYLFDEDGFQMYCSICSDGQHVILCDVPGCYRSYCSVCLDMFCGEGYAMQISTKDEWKCFMCTGEEVGLLQRRDDWQERLKEVFHIDSDEYDPPTFFDPIPFALRKPISVLSLFDGISTGYLALQDLDLEVEMYKAAETNDNAIKVALVHNGSVIEQVGDVQMITKRKVEEWGPFDLLIGGSPCNDLSIANPLKKGIYEGTGRLFFEFYRILEYCKSKTDRPFFWLFENVVGMRHTDKEVISRFLQCHPVIVNAKDVSSQHRARYFWGNLPGMNRSLCPLPSDRLNLQQCLEKDCGRTARFEKIRCITTSQNSLKQTKKAMLPVEWNMSDGKQIDDGLWMTEIERIFGFPKHYTDVANMGQRDRQKLLGKCWSVPVIRHLLAPLRDYFKCKSSSSLTPGNTGPVAEEAVESVATGK